MYKLMFIAITVIFTFSVALPQTWNSTLTLSTSSLSYSSSDMIDMYTNSDGIHIIVHQSSKIHHYLYNNAGSEVRHSERASFTETPRLSRLVGYNDNVYIIYKNGSDIYTQRSTNGGSTWSSSIDEIELSYSTVNGLEAVADEDGLHVVWAEEQSTDHFETYYEKLLHTGTTWTDSKTVTDYSGHEGGAPSITTAPDINKIFIVYSDRDEDDPYYGTVGNNYLRIKESSSWLDPAIVIPQGPCWTSGIINNDDYLFAFPYLPGDRSGQDPIEFSLQSWYRDIDYEEDEYFTYINYDLTGDDASLDDEDKVDLTSTSNGLIHMVYESGKYRDWNSGTLSGETSMDGSAPHRISSSSNDIYCVGIYNNSGDLQFKLKQRDYAPLAPTNLEVTASNNHPRLDWDANPEPDLKEYDVWSYFTASDPTWRKTATVTNNYWTDDEASTLDPAERIYYKVKAVDDEDNESSFSNTVYIDGYFLEKPIIAISEIPTTFLLNQNYPNPFNPETKIQFGLPEDSNVKLQIFNIQGQIVTTLVDEPLAAGYHTATFDATSFPSGVYFYKLVAGNFIDIKRMLLVK